MRYPFAPSETEIEVLSSRFIAVLLPLDDDKSVRDLLSAAAKKYPHASHYVYAYRNLPFEGYSDDGEPKGTAGLPVLETIRQTATDKALLIVVRYFGGHKLGASRLTRTYREAAGKALSTYPEALYVEQEEARVSTDYRTASAFEKEALCRGFRVFDKDYGDLVTLSVAGDAKIIGPFLEGYEGLTIRAKKREVKRIPKV